MNDNRRASSKPGCRWWLWGGIALVVGGFLAVVMPDSPPAGVRAGAVCVVDPERGAWFAQTDEAFNDLVDAQNANSGPLIGRLLSRGVIFREPQGSRVRVVRVSFGSAWCRVEAGANVGQEGWVQRELITPED